MFFGSYKTRHILLSKGANCTVLRAVVLTLYRRVTDGRTEGIAIAIASIARAVKNRTICFDVYVRMCMRILYLVLSFIENPIKLSSLHAIHACNSRLPSLRLIENARPLYFTQCFNSFSDDCKATFSELSHMHGVTGVALAATNNVHICIHRSSASVLPLHLTRDLIAIAFYGRPM